jgi:hypothetical protein
LEDLRALLESTTLGDPMRPLFWVSKSHAKLAQALRERGHRVSASRIPQWLDRLGYRRQVNRKSLEGGHHVDRNAQFEHINSAKRSRTVSMTSAPTSVASASASITTPPNSPSTPFAAGVTPWDASATQRAAA